MLATSSYPGDGACDRQPGCPRKRSTKTAAALGIDDGELRKRIAGLRTLFTARNEVSHALDLRRPERPGDRTRRSRAIGPTKSLCEEGLEVAQLIVNAAGAVLGTQSVS